MKPDAAQDDEVDLRHYVHILNRHKWAVAIFAIAAAGLALGLSLLQTKVYQADTRLVLQPDPAAAVFNSQSGERNDPGRAIQTQIQILKSEPVRRLVQTRLGSVPGVAASQVGDTDVISVRARDADPERAAAVANAYASKYVEYRQTSAVDSLLRAAKEINQQVTSLQGQADSLDAQIQGRPAGAANDLKAQRDSLIQQIGAFRQQLDQVQVQSRLKEGGAQVIAPAEVPNTPVEPKPGRNALLGLVLGLLAGVGFAFVREQFDDSVRSKEDIEFVSKLPLLSIIPRSLSSPDTVISLTDPKSPAAEAYRGLRTSVQFANLDNPMTILQVTSPSQGEGKTTTLANLGVTLAGAGLRVIVMCCDLRRPRVHQLFGLENNAGFTSVLLGDVPLPEALQDVPGASQLKVLSAGPPPPNPSELLSHSRTGELIASLATHADFVLIDSAPVLPVTDALVLSKWVHGVAVVASANETSRRALGRTFELLNQVNAPVIGTVLNGVSPGGSGYGYGYGYGYTYGYGDGETNGRGAGKAADEARPTLRKRGIRNLARR